MTTKYTTIITQSDLRDNFFDVIDSDLAEYLYHIHDGKRFKVTVEALEDDIPEETVTVTLRELFDRATDDNLSSIGVDVWYIAEGGNPDAKKTIPKSVAMEFMNEYEFEARMNKQS